ncbi:hypothetical protein Peur_023520 [Populus x canadensis]
MCLSNGEADVFNKYKDDKGNFKGNLTKDVKGLLSLYEASYLSAHGEIILDEALVFTETHLKSMVARLVSPLADQVTHALNRPVHGGIVKYEQWWWKELDFTTKLPFAQDRLIECYIVVLGLFIQPQYALARQILTKSTMMKNGVFSCTYPLLTVSSLCGMGKIVSKEVFDWLFTHPKILASTSDLFRLIDDVASHEHGVSKQDAHDELTKLVESNPKEINMEPLGIPEKFLQVFLNFARVADVFYSDYDAFTESRTMAKDMLAALLINPMPIE